MYKSEVFKSWTLVLQLGISMLVPIFLLIAFSCFLKEKFGIDFMLFFVILGFAVGIRNVYVILKNYLKTMSDGKNSESELMKKHLKSMKKTEK